jgi:serine protease Do
MSETHQTPKPLMARLSGGRRLAAALMVTTVLAGAGGIAIDRSVSSGPAWASNGTAAPALGAPASFHPLVERVAPAVVNIATTVERPATRPEGMAPMPDGAPFEEFFRRFFENQSHDGGAPATRPAQALGSGFVIDADGHVVTNNHVIDGASEITVVLDDGREFEATLVGTDPQTDLAVLKIEADRDLPHVDFGNSDRTNIGDWVVAVGNPFGLGGTVTAGVVSARGRNLNAGPYDDFLQIDAPINRGNSGGPTFNLDGEVVGVNAAIYSPNGGSVGIGFAIPASLAKPIVDQLIETGSVERGWLGVSIQAVTPEIAEAIGLDEARGALIADVGTGSPAAAAGFEQGDVVIRFDGQPVEESHDLPRMVAAVTAGATVEAVVLRDGEETPLDVTVGEMPAERSLAAAEAPASADALGLTLATIDEEARRAFGLPADATGVVVTDVAADSPLAAEGVRPGTVIEAIDRQPVATPDEVAAAVEAARAEGKQAVLLLVSRDGRERFVATRIA